MLKHPRPRISFITGIDENYFLMCGALMQSLERHFPLVPFYVADFGLSEGQKAFFSARGMLLPMPAGMKKGDHPYTFKSHLGSLLDESLGAPVWLDADVIATGDGTEALQAVAQAMLEKGQRFALAPGTGSADGKATPLADVAQYLATPRLAAYAARRPEIAGQPYLNVGLVVFRPGDRLDDWRELASAYEGDQCWEQNAMNQLCYDNPQAMQLLDTRAWNVHGGLLDQLSMEGERLMCDGVACLFAHVTSAHSRHLTWGEMDFDFEGSRYKNFVKFFTYPPLRAMQQALMGSFLKEHLRELRELGVLAAPA